MSELRVDNIVSQDGSAAPVYSKGIIIGAGQSITDQGDFIVEGSSTLQGSVNITNTGITTVAGTLDVTSTGISTFTGSIWVGGAGTVTGSLDVLGGGTLNTAGIITASFIDVTTEIQYANLAVLTGNVGVGTTSLLGARLNVNDDILISAGSTLTDMALRAYTQDGGAISFEELDGSSQYFSVSKDDTFLFAVNDDSFNSQFVVSIGGSTGIGLTNPTSKLHVIGDGLFTTNLVVGIATTVVGSVGVGTTNPLGRLQVGVAGTNVFVIENGGDVGIGTTNPTSKLHVIGDAKVGVDTSQGIILTSPNSTQYRLIVDDSGNLSTTAV